MYLRETLVEKAMNFIDSCWFAAGTNYIVTTTNKQYKEQPNYSLILVVASLKTHSIHNSIHLVYSKIWIPSPRLVYCGRPNPSCHRESFNEINLFSISPICFQTFLPYTEIRSIIALDFVFAFQCFHRKMEVFGSTSSRLNHYQNFPFPPRTMNAKTSKPHSIDKKFLWTRTLTNIISLIHLFILTFIFFFSDKFTFANDVSARVLLFDGRK